MHMYVDETGGNELAGGVNLSVTMAAVAVANVNDAVAFVDHYSVPDECVAVPGKSDDPTSTYDGTHQMAPAFCRRGPASSPVGDRFVSRCDSMPGSRCAHHKFDEC